MDADKQLWLVWSHEHDGYWPQNRRGYIKNRRDAGRFTFNEAVQIINEGNLGMRGFRPQETMLPSTNPLDPRHLPEKL